MSLFSLINKLLLSNLSKMGVSNISSHNILGKLLNADTTVIDLGANKGHFYTSIYNIYNCNIYAVEASPKLHETLPKVDKLQTFNYAIGSTNNKIPFYISENDEASSIHSKISNAWIANSEVLVQGIIFEDFIKKHSINISKIDLLKVDIEGAELDLIESLNIKTLDKICQIAIEFHDFIDSSPDYILRLHRALKKLRDNNFTIIHISSTDYREVLCFNKKNIKLSLSQKVRLKVFHRSLKFFKDMHIRIGQYIRK